MNLCSISTRIRTWPASERGQGTAEYALVLVAVAAMVGVVIAYVSGDGGGMITGLFGAAFAKMRSLVGG
jgi:Flp pilus assembly pilin Flp